MWGRTAFVTWSVADRTAEKHGLGEVFGDTL